MESGEEISSGKPRAKSTFPWLALILLLVSVYVFWVLPRQIGNPAVQVEFSDR